MADVSQNLRQVEAVAQLVDGLTGGQRAPAHGYVPAAAGPME